MVVLSALKFMRVTCLGLVGAGCAVTARPPHAAHIVASRAVTRATALGRLGRLGLAEAGRPAALPRAAVLGAAAAALRYRCVHTIVTPHAAMLSLLSHRRRIHACTL